MKKIVAVPGIFVVETVDSQKLASLLDGAWSKLERPNKEKLKIMVQINTSNEEGMYEKNNFELLIWMSEQKGAIFSYLR